MAHLTKTKIMAANIRYVTFIENIKGFVYIIIHQKDFLSFNLFQKLFNINDSSLKITSKEAKII